MIKEIIATGVDANAAIESGALLLGLPREEVQFEIIDLPRKGGFLGLKKLPAKVRVWVELLDEKPARSEKPAGRRPPRRNRKPKISPPPPRRKNPPGARNPLPASKSPSGSKPKSPLPWR